MSTYRSVVSATPALTSCCVTPEPQSTTYPAPLITSRVAGFARPGTRTRGPPPVPRRMRRVREPPPRARTRRGHDAVTSASAIAPARNCRRVLDAIEVLLRLTTRPHVYGEVGAEDPVH